MRGTIRLERSIKVHCWRATGTVARSERRSELHSILLLADEFGYIDRDDVDRELLGGYRNAVAERLLKICELYGLLEKNGRGYCLTKEGHRAAEREEVFIPEYGTWTIWASHDPLLALPDEEFCGLLRVEPWEESSAYDEMLGDDKDLVREIVSLPTWMEDLSLEQMLSANQSPYRIRVHQLKDKAEKVEPDAELRLVWELPPNKPSTLYVEGLLANKRVKQALPTPKLSDVEVWCYLLSEQGLLERWDEKAGGLRKTFGTLTRKEKEQMKGSLRFDVPYIDEYGEFFPTKVNNVPILAASLEDAQKWAEWRLNNHYARSWALADDFASWKQKAKEDFPSFSEAIELPSRRQVIEQMKPQEGERPTRSYWLFQAPEDWSL